MASYEVPDHDESDEESDGDILSPRSNQELRLTKLGSAIPIPPQSDIPESEGPEEVLPEVTMLNSLIMSGGNCPRTSEAPPSSATGKLKRPSLDLTHKEPTKVSREDPYEIEASPEPVAHRSSRLIRQKVSKKPKISSLPSRPQRQIRTASRKGMLDTDPLSTIVVESHSTMNRVHQTYEFRERDPKRRKLENVASEAQDLRSDSICETSRRVSDSPALISTSGQRVTRSSKLPVTSGFDLSQPLRRRHRGKDRSTPLTQGQPIVSDNDLSPAVDRQQSYSKSPRQGHPRSRQLVGVVVDNPASTRLPSESTNINEQPTSPPAGVEDSPITKASPVSPADVVQDHRQEPMSLDHPADPVSPVVDIKDVQTPVAEESLRSTREDSGIFEPCTQHTRDTRSQAEILEADAENIGIQELHERYQEDDSEDDFAGSENVNDEKNSREDILVPKELDAALEFAHLIHEEADSVRQRFDGIDILKRFNTLKKSVLRWKAARNYSETDRLIQLSQKTRKEATAIFQKSEWDQQDVISMIARIKEVIKVFNRRFKDLKVAKSTAEAIQRQQTQELRQEEVDRIQRQQTQRSRQEEVEQEDEDELKRKKWRHRWTVLHDQRLGAAMEGRTFLSGEQSHHLRQIPLDKLHVAVPYWDDTDSFYLVEGLEKFQGPNVYRDIFRKYCRHGGPLQQFNVAEIVDKAVSLRKTLIKLVEDDGEEPEQWVKDIFDPRVPP
ncbi:hypothetical protein KCU65_g6428, partial [Aureobasidium melanogenum]